LYSPMIVSIRALSNASPTVPTEAVIPSSCRCSVKRSAVYWADSTGRCNTPERGGVDGTTTRLGDGSDGTAADAVAWSAAGSA
jgi:hypothetical protein